MSKQLKYKLKKTLKNAEFVHADLEYHQELSEDAIRDFQQEVSKWLSILSDEDKQKANNHRNRQARPPQNPPQNAPPPADACGADCKDTDLIASDTEVEEQEEPTPKATKATELKKLFYRIAEKTHPDKVEASGVSGPEISRMERIFIRAKEAYDQANWYILYAITIDLNLSIDDPDDEKVEWIEEDIKKTLAKIATLSNLTAWHWYVGDEPNKKRALKFYFQQAYGLDHPGL